MSKDISLKDIEAMAKEKDPKRFKYNEETGNYYINIRDLELEAVEGVDIPKLEKIARIVRGFAFAAINNIKSGHPGGSSSKVEQLLTLMTSGFFAFDPQQPKHPSETGLYGRRGIVRL